jgi:hypothetical protein
MVVRDEAKNFVYLYAHTDVAQEVLLAVDECEFDTDVRAQLCGEEQ